MAYKLCYNLVRATGKNIQGGGKITELGDFWIAFGVRVPLCMYINTINLPNIVSVKGGVNGAIQNQNRMGRLS